ncbi:MAG: hypothetical protein HKM93_20120 [Desulfobacteraceae bacterium]|nr:hypothetical protein [Desulfobacteraceae bacterium]
MPQRIALIVLVVICLPKAALATQGHSGIEGVYVHQLAHLFFMISMGILIYWLRSIRLIEESGWRYIQYAAIFFILWNVDAMAVHYLDEQIAVVRTERISQWQIRIEAAGDSRALVFVYYLLKLDHLLCVPAMILLLTGLKRLLRSAPSSKYESAG